MGTSGSLLTVVYQKSGWLTITNTAVTNVAVNVEGIITGVAANSIQVTFRPATAMSSGDKVVCTATNSGGSAAAVFGSDTGSATVPTVRTPSMTITAAAISGSASVYTFTVTGAVPNNADAVFTIPSVHLAIFHLQVQITKSQ
jgi:hypothetical protein